jgi:hypothetical protein
MGPFDISTSAEITLPSVVSDWLINVVSLKVAPSVLASFCLSEPARSIKCNCALLVSPSCSLTASTSTSALTNHLASARNSPSICRLNIVWDRDDSLFIAVAARRRLCTPPGRSAFQTAPRGTGYTGSNHLLISLSRSQLKSQRTCARL